MTGSIVAAKVRIPNAPSMPVDRLDAQLDAVWRYRLGLVIAPAGSGKTTLLARFATRARAPVAWYRAEGWDRDESSLLAHLEAALTGAVDDIERGWETVADAANALSAWPGQRLLLIVDDLHTLEGTAAEAALELLIDYAPASVTVLAASRVPPRFNLPRLRVSGDLLELTGDDLRFRSWEVERLFHDFYGEPMPPEELARLARRTEGWAAGLQLFHLATRGRTPDERRRLLAELGSSSRLTREYLTRNVLSQLPPELRRFLVETSVLGRLNGSLCDRLIGGRGSAETLADLESRRMFTQPLAEDGVYRYHEVLRSHLHNVLLDELGEDALRARFRTAGELLYEVGALPEALEAYCRGGDWERARRLLGGQGQAVADGASAWIDALPAAIVMHDPWLLLASARHLRGQGRFADAVERYQRAEQAFGSADTAARCRDERQMIATWLGRPLDRSRDGSSMLRSALAHEPLARAREARSRGLPESEIVAGLAALAAGQVGSARRELQHASETVSGNPVMQAVAAVAAGVCGLLMGQEHAALEVSGGVAAAEGLGQEWLARLGRASLAVTGSAEALNEARAVAAASAAIGDDWGQALARLAVARGELIAGREPANLDDLVDTLRRLDAGALEAWARGIAALARARANLPDAHEAALTAEAAARSAGSDAGRMLAYLALAELAASETERAEYADLANVIAAETGLQPPPLMEPPPPSVAPSTPAVHQTAPPVSIRVFAAFVLKRDGTEVDLTAVRPRARALLRLLCLNAGSAIHHELIEAALWPEAAAEAGGRNLHVAIAGLRRALEPDAVRGSFRLLVREGDAYRLVLPRGSDVDLLRFERALTEAKTSSERGDRDGAARAYQEALDWYRGDLLPEDGPAEWVTHRREECQLAAVAASQALAETLLERGDAPGAARACTVGLRFERYHDPLWRLLIRARDEAGDQGAATRARLSYDRVLAELGVATATSPAV